MFDPYNYSFEGMSDEDLNSLLGEDESEIVEILSDMNLLAGRLREADNHKKYTKQICKIEKMIKDFLD